MKISQMMRQGCPDTTPLTFQDELKVTQKNFLRNALRVFADYLRRARNLEAASVNDGMERDVVEAKIDSGEGTKVRAGLVIGFLPKSMSEIRLRIKGASGKIVDERVLHDAMRQSAEDVGEWIQRCYEMAFPPTR